MSVVCNRETLVIPMMETLDAVNCVEELAAVEDVDSLLISTNDLCTELRIPGEYENPRLTEVYGKTISTCKKHGKWVVVGGLQSRLDFVEKFCAMGARWVMAVTDGPLLPGGAIKRAAEMTHLSARVKKWKIRSSVQWIDRYWGHQCVDVRGRCNCGGAEGTRTAKRNCELIKHCT
jgi:hypothetical protein